ncbi:hypothetical protein M569_10448 [Genlisea aurea]|uniref:Uncharacterized protein n=1 Tax=Genlisea aurea TaxID=192259 RepID=S8DMY6_9LAMI|nr:hypothetical protein M569_10448 [Genlisea aurea]
MNKSIVAPIRRRHPASSPSVSVSVDEASITGFFRSHYRSAISQDSRGSSRISSSKSIF